MVKDTNTRLQITFSNEAISILEEMSKRTHMTKSELVEYAVRNELGQELYKDSQSGEAREHYILCKYGAEFIPFGALSDADRTGKAWSYSKEIIKAALRKFLNDGCTTQDNAYSVYGPGVGYNRDNTHMVEVTENDCPGIAGTFGEAPVSPNEIISLITIHLIKFENLVFSQKHLIFTMALANHKQKSYGIGISKLKDINVKFEEPYAYETIIRHVLKELEKS